MASPWLAAGLAVPALFLLGSGKNKDGSKSKKGGKSSRGDSLVDLDEFDRPVDDSADPSFVCERVCASHRLLRRMGGLSRDATPSSCITVCGPVQEDACAEACQRAVCASLHQVPAWNDACLKRCTTECTRGRAG